VPESGHDLDVVTNGSGTVLMTDTLSPRFYRALSLAFELHGRDRRKGSSVPVLAHLLSVCAIVQQDGGSEDEAIAALLHDSLEDKPELVDEQLLRKRFGANVLHLVQVATDTPPGWKGGVKPPWRERKQAYIDRIATEPASSLRPTVADKIDNVRAILADLQRVGDELWKIFKAGKADQLGYYSSCYRAYVKAGASPRLLAQLRSLLEELARVTRHPIELGPSAARVARGRRKANHAPARPPTRGRRSPVSPRTKPTERG